MESILLGTGNITAANSKHVYGTCRVWSMVVSIFTYINLVLFETPTCYYHPILLWDNYRIIPILMMNKLKPRKSSYLSKVLLSGGVESVPKQDLCITA